MEENQENNTLLAGHNGYKKLIKFTLPIIGMMIVTSIYGIVDGLFVSNVVGEKAFASLNLIMPYVMILSSFGFMIGTGGSALIAKTFGEGDYEKGNKYFSMFIWFLLIVGGVITALGEVFLRPVAIAFGAEGDTLEGCVLYGATLIGFIVTMMLQYAFQSFLTLAEKQKMALVLTIVSGVSNMIFDFLLVYVFRLGLVGAAVATAMSWVVGGVVPVFYFAFPNKTHLRLKFVRLKLRPILKGCYNGLSEMSTNVALSVAGMLYNFQLMRFLGEDGVNAYGIIMYVGFIFIGVLVGYSMGVSPIIGFNYGAGEKKEIGNIIKKSFAIIGISSVVLTAFAEIFARPLALIFVGYSESLTALTAHALRINFLSFLIAGFNIFASSFFTSLGNGTISAVLSLSRCFVFQVAFIFLLPLFMGADGIWYAVLLAEAVCLILTAVFLLKGRKKYGY